MTTNEIRAIMIQAMKDKDTPKKELFQILLNNSVAEEKRLGRLLTAADVDAVLAKEKKQMEDSLSMAGDREDFAEPLRKKIVIVESYLPKQLSDGELKTAIKTAIQTMEIRGEVANMGTVMRLVVPVLKGMADGGRINKMVTKVLEENE